MSNLTMINVSYDSFIRNVCNIPQFMNKRKGHHGRAVVDTRDIEQALNKKHVDSKTITIPAIAESFEKQIINLEVNVEDLNNLKFTRTNPLQVYDKSISKIDYEFITEGDTSKTKEMQTLSSEIKEEYSTLKFDEYKILPKQLKIQIYHDGGFEASWIDLINSATLMFSDVQEIEILDKSKITFNELRPTLRLTLVGRNKWLVEQLV
jgi:hypothetical protein